MNDQRMQRLGAPFPESAMDTEEVVDVLNDLLVMTRTVRGGCVAWAEAVQATRALKEILLGRAQAFRHAEVQLVAMIRGYGAEPTKTGASGSTLARGWRPLPANPRGHSDASILNACARGEDAAVSRYRQALREPLPMEVRKLVQQQFEGVQRNHAKIRGLRDAVRSHRS